MAKGIESTHVSWTEEAQYIDPETVDILLQNIKGTTTMRHYITGCNLATLVQTAYRLSKPQGLGFMHYTEGDLPDEDIAKILVDQKRLNGSGNLFLRLDYVRGRSVKLTVFRENDKLYLNDEWYDHTPEQQQELLEQVRLTE